MPDNNADTSEPRPPRAGARSLAQMAVFAGVIAALGLVPAFQPPGMTVPITLQSMGVMLAGAILGARKGFGAVLLFLALVAIGLPLLAGGRGGLAVFTTPSVGFLLAFPFAAFVIGWLTERKGAPYSIPWGIAYNILGGIIFVYVFGILGVMLVADLSLSAAVIAMAVYIPGDLVKAVVTAFVAKPVHAAYPGLLRERQQVDEPVHVEVS